MDAVDYRLRTDFRDQDMYVGNSISSHNRELVIQLGPREDRRGYCISVPSNSQLMNNGIQTDLKTRLFNVD